MSRFAVDPARGAYSASPSLREELGIRLEKHLLEPDHVVEDQRGWMCQLDHLAMNIHITRLVIVWRAVHEVTLYRVLTTILQAIEIPRSHVLIVFENDVQAKHHHAHAHRSFILSIFVLL